MPDHSSFDKVLESEVFIDKTLLIEALHTQPRPHFVVKTPKKFGKTTNLDMVKRFFEVQVDQNGSIIPPTLTDNYKLFSKLYKKPEGYDFLNIFKRKRFFHDHFGQYPVISLDFKNLVEGFYFRFIELVKNVFSYHKYLLHSKELRVEDKLVFKRYYKFVPNVTFLIDNPMWHQERLRVLAKLLVKHFGTKVILLIDNYDSPTEDVMFENKSRWHWNPEKIGEHLEEAVQVLIDYWNSESDLIEITLINASIPPKYAFGHFESEIKHLSFTEKHAFNEFYGIHEKELFILAEKFIFEDKLSLIQKWYGGYKIINSNLQIFNIYSVLNYIQSNKFGSYWVKKQDINIIEQTLKSKNYPLIRQNVKTLCDGGQIQIANEITGNHIYQIRYIVNDIADFSMRTESYLLFFNLMLDLGFCSVVDENNTILTIKIINDEVRREIITILFRIEEENS